MAARRKANQAKENIKELQKLVADVQEYCKEKAKEIGAQTSKKPEYILQLIHASTTFKST
jgi:phage host-nuclease inhibitor protein Gam